MNVQTAANASAAAIPHLQRSATGRVVNVGANGALKAGLGIGAYAAPKTGVHSPTQALCQELKADGVTVNAVLPSIIDTPTNRADIPKADFANWVRPEEVAAVMLFLTSLEAGPQLRRARMAASGGHILRRFRAGRPGTHRRARCQRGCLPAPRARAGRSPKA